MAEATPQQPNRKMQSKKPSPLQLYQLEHCNHCSSKCNPSEQRFLTCQIAELLDRLHQNNKPNKPKGAY